MESFGKKEALLKCSSTVWCGGGYWRRTYFNLSCHRLWFKKKNDEMPGAAVTNERNRVVNEDDEEGREEGLLCVRRAV